MTKRDKIEEILEKYRDSIINHVPTLEKDDIADQILALDDWISVEDRLPEDYKPVMVYVRNFGGMIFNDGQHIDDGELVGWEREGDGGYPTLDVTHWKPLTEAPK